MNVPSKRYDDFIFWLPKMIKNNRFLNTLGLRCPEPLMLIRQSLSDMQPGEILEISSDDPSSSRDIFNFCRHNHHQLLSVEPLTTHQSLFKLVKGSSSFCSKRP